MGEFSKKRTTKNADGALSETFTNSAEQGVISQLDYFDHDITNDANISGYYVVQPDDFVYNPRISATAPCGPINRNRLDRAGVMSPLYTVFSVDASVDKTYLEHYFKTSRWHDFMFLEGNSGARSDRFSISDATFFEMPIWCPEISEQKAIAKQLETADHLITLHQRKYDKLCTVKKSMLDKMFPKPGETEPEIRFEGFTDPWEQRKLGEVATRHDNLRIPITAKDRIPGDTPYYGANGIQDYVEGYTHEGEFVLVAEDGATDLDNYPVQLISGLSWVNNHAHVIKAIPDVAQNRFIMHLIKSMDIASYLVGGTRSKLNAEVLMGIELKLPSNSEQIYIGALLSTLDSLITLHQREPPHTMKEGKNANRYQWRIAFLRLLLAMD